MARRTPPSSARSLPPVAQPAASPAEAADRLKAAARRLGFDPVGIAPAALPEADRRRFLAWLGRGQEGTMAYMARDPEARTRPAHLLEGAEALLMVGLAYAARDRPSSPLEGEPDREPARAAAGEAGPKGAGDGEAAAGPRGTVSTYAQAPYDYHRVLAGRLDALAAHWSQLVPGARARRFCDTAPLLERPFAALAGLGFVGKNTNLIHRGRGSYFFLGGLVLDRALPPDEPDRIGSCGTCTRCLDACPTGAFPAPYVLDARRCIAYLTIEHRGAYAPDLRADVGAHVFGCDICQAVCPWNAKFAAPPDPELAPDPTRSDPPLLALLERALAGFKSLARDTPWERTGKRGFLRNVATALGNVGDDADGRHGEALAGLAAHEDPGVAEHARWALERLEERSLG